MSLASTNPHQMLRAETALDQWHGCSQAVEWSWDSMQISAPGCRCDEQYLEKVLFLWLWHAVPGMAGCVQDCIEASNEPCICKFTLDASGIDISWTCLANMPPIMMDIKGDWFMKVLATVLCEKEWTGKWWAWPAKETKLCELVFSFWPVSCNNAEGDP